MKRTLTVLLAFAFIFGAFMAVSAAAYAVAAWVSAAWFPGAGRLTNILFLMLIFVMIFSTVLTIADRKWGAMMQDRIGPNRAQINLPGLRGRSLGGLPHVAADALKMLTKEDFIPAAANRFLFWLGPVLAFAPVFALFAVVPAGPTVNIGGSLVEMVVATPDFGILYVFAIASLAVYGTSLAGWSSNNKLALLGGVRASSQMISYEVALGLSLVGLMLAFSTVQLPEMVARQGDYLWRLPGDFDIGLPAWGILLQPLGFIGFFAASFAETKRAPFDLPEGESEIIGFFVEYSGMKFGMFLISEYMEVVILAAITTVVFLGGYHLPFGEEWLSRQAIFTSYPLLWGALLGMVFWIKVLLLVWIQLVIRWSFPRFRYDHIQTLGWKMLLPAGLINVFLSAALVLWDPSLKALTVVGILEIGLVLAYTLSRPLPEQAPHAPLPPHGVSAAHPH